jgi:protein-S-isoprenylcysteine O-methyltransferase Ste14
MKLDPGITISAVWIIFLLYWIISGFTAKKIEKRESRGGIIARVLTLAIAWALLANADDPRLGVLSTRFLPYEPWIGWLGAAMTLFGVAFAIWARIHIGRYWSASVALKSEHQLIRSGPYARIRHPIYTGMIVALAGTAIAVGRYAALLALAIYFVSFWIKARREEALLAGQFGAAFDEHRRSTGFLLPRLSSPR